MKESALAAVTYARSRAHRLGLDPRFHRDLDIHIHMPEISKPLTPKLEKAYAAMQVIEDVRDPCVRGGKKITKKIVRDVEAAYTAAVTLCREVVEEAGVGEKKSAAKPRNIARRPASRRSAAGRKRR